MYYYNTTFYFYGKKRFFYTYNYLHEFDEMQQQKKKVMLRAAFKTLWRKKAMMFSRVSVLVYEVIFHCHDFLLLC